MRKFVKIVLLIMILSLSLTPMLANAQTDTSTGCLAVNGFTGTGTTFSFDAQEFNAGDVLIVVEPTGEFEFVVSDGGTPLVALAEASGVFITAMETAEYSLSIDVPDGDDTTEIEIFCLPSLNGEIDPEYNDYADGGTICHIPPGNPDNAHTITVGAGAIAAHLGHGDTLGACPDGVDTSIPDFGAGVVIFFDDGNGTANIYGSCEGDDCSLIASIDITILVPVVGGEFEFDDNDDDDYSVIVYYLHPLTDGDNEYEGEDEDSNIYVFQINIFLGGEVASDNSLLIIDGDGNLLAWTDHSIWDNLEEFLAVFEIDLPEDDD